MKLAFLADEITTFIKDHDSTWAIMQAAFAAGDEVFYGLAAALSVEENQACAQLIQLDQEFFDYQLDNQAKLLKFPVPALDENPQANKYPCKKTFLDEMDIVFMRKDPPLDEHYQAELQILNLCKKAYVSNKPTSLLAWNEKLAILNFPNLITKTIVSNDVNQIKNFITENSKSVIKPLDGKGGQGIFVLDENDKNLSAILETSLNSYNNQSNTNLLMVQKYIPEIKSQGDKRIILIKGKPIAALLRVPSAGDNRGNLAAGASFKDCEMTERDLEISASLQDFLIDNKIDLAGIDIIGDYLTEINITSPTCLQEINRLKDYRGTEKLESKLLEAIKVGL